MKRIIGATLGLLLGATVSSAFAQDYSRGRDTGSARDEARAAAIDSLRNEDSRGRDEGRGRGERQQQQPPQQQQPHVAPSAPAYSQEQRQGRGERQGGGQYQGQGRGQGRDQTPNYGLANPHPQQQWSGDRQDRRQDYRQDRRDDRQDYRQDRRDDRWDNRQDYRQDYRRDHRDDRNDWRNDHRYRGYDRHNWSGRYSWRNDWNHGWTGHRYRSPSRYYYPRGYSRLSWSIGFRLPSVFYGPSYYVDYRPYGLAPPPYGYRWIRADEDLLLVDLQNGEIVDVIYDFFY